MPERFENWLQKRGVSVDQALVPHQKKLRGFTEKGRVAYREKTVLRLFLVSWLKEFKTRSWAELKEDSPESVRLFELAVLLATNHGWKQQRARFTRLRPRDLGSHAHLDQTAYENFAVTNTEIISAALHEHFDPTRKSATRGVISYAEAVAVSHFVKNRVYRSREKDGYLLRYLEESGLKLRTRLAFKLAYIPLAITPEEEAILASEFGVTFNPWQALRINAVAQLLGFPGGPALSRRLYKVRRWANSWHSNAAHRALASSTHTENETGRNR